MEPTDSEPRLPMLRAGDVHARFPGGIDALAGAALEMLTDETLALNGRLRWKAIR